MAKGIYLGGPITGLSWDKAHGWRLPTAAYFLSRGIPAYSPLRGQHALEGAQEIKDTPQGSDLTLQANVINRTDLRTIQTCPLMLMKFIDAQIVSIGSVLEVGYGYALGKFIVAVIEEGNMHLTPKFGSCLTEQFPVFDDAVQFTLDQMKPGGNMADHVYLKGPESNALAERFGRHGIKSYLGCENQPLTMAVGHRDFMNIRESDMVLLDLRGHTTVDVDSVLDIGYARALDKVIIVVAESKSKYATHPMVQDSAIVTADMEQAMKIVEKELLAGA